MEIRKWSEWLIFQDTNEIAISKSDIEVTFECGNTAAWKCGIKAGDIRVGDSNQQNCESRIGMQQILGTDKNQGRAK